LCNGIVWASFEPALDLAAMWRGCGNGQGEQPLSARNIITAWKSCDALLQCTRNAFVPKSGNRQRSLLRRNGNDFKMLPAFARTAIDRRADESSRPIELPAAGKRAIRARCRARRWRP
jgi:hypothetical protein